jgi:hypothetical protein
MFLWSPWIIGVPDHQTPVFLAETPFVKCLNWFYPQSRGLKWYSSSSQALKHFCLLGTGVWGSEVWEFCFNIVKDIALLCVVHTSPMDLGLMVCNLGSWHCGKSLGITWITILGKSMFYNMFLPGKRSNPVCVWSYVLFTEVQVGLGIIIFDSGRWHSGQPWAWHGLPY